jgi:hypothetical protein
MASLAIRKPFLAEDFENAVCLFALITKQPSDLESLVEPAEDIDRGHDNLEEIDGEDDAIEK